ncbi:leucine-rich repeat-containing protein 69-like isoform X1 [Lytechinus variegatus]|uniref:leucine-rich repeat-containing protein 69-like isoform X1 n=1 Tax=Lytechinus variegatus TaxID=7654 RepID=UPI001BB1E78F|nr:leucine-rich repeat-containing protein 69-like isoform X1 [Lytechinus variegatus]
MADTLVLRALKGQPQTLNLSSKNLSNIPRAVGKLYRLQNLQLKSNKIVKLPKEFTSLTTLVTLNLGNNCLEEIPDELCALHSLEVLHLFNNKIQNIESKTLGSLRHLKFLNLNNNKIKSLPVSMNKLINLEYLSVDGNQLTTLPGELCALSHMVEIHAANNQLTSLPMELGFLVKLKKFHVQQNRIKELPEGMGKLRNLEVIDVAANELRIFPTELHKLPLKELYCEENPLLDKIPVQSIQEDEVLTLKELTARYVMKQLKDRRRLVKVGGQLFYEENPAWSYLRRAIRHYPNVRDMLAQASKCALCGESFLNTWLECVCFVDGHKDLKLGNSPGKIPIRALLCSYKCFNQPGHGFYGVAFP